MTNLKIKKYHTYPVKVPLRIAKSLHVEIPYGNFVVLKIDTNSDISEIPMFLLLGKICKTHC